MSSALNSQSHRGVDSGVTTGTSADASSINMSADFGIAREQSVRGTSRRVNVSLPAGSTLAADVQALTQET